MATTGPIFVQLWCDEHGVIGPPMWRRCVDQADISVVWHPARISRVSELHGDVPQLEGDHEDGGTSGTLRKYCCVTQRNDHN